MIAFAGMTVNVQVPDAGAMAVNVHMNTLTNQSSQHVDPEHHLHHAHAEFEQLGHPLRDGFSEHQNEGPDHQQHQRVTNTPGDALPHGLKKRRSTRGERRNRRQVVGLGCMLHTEEESDQ